MLKLLGNRLKDHHNEGDNRVSVRLKGFVMSSVGIAILAAGKGTRLKIDRSKALCPALGKSLVDYVINESQKFSELAAVKCHFTAVIGHKKEQVQKHIEEQFPGKCSFAWQKEQKGTADALRAYFDECPDNWKHDFTFVCCADTPLLESETFHRMWNEMQSNTKLKACAGTFRTQTPTGYGRILRGKSGFRIVEEKDANQDERKINEVNSGFYLVKTDYLKEHLSKIGNNNKSGEFYLTDIFGQVEEVLALEYTDSSVFLGVNTLQQLEEVTQVLRQRKSNRLMNEGVMMLDAASTYIDWDVLIGAESVIYPGVNLFGKTNISNSVTIETGAVLKDSTIEAGSTIFAYSHLEKVTVRKGAQVGPFARLRPDSDVGEGAKIGNFVEVKKSKLSAGVKVSHLSYVGDAEIDKDTNIGCGFITCNYDGVNKHKTKIGKNVFVGSDVQVVAPIEIGDNSFVAAGSTITKNVPEGAFAIARSSQSTKEGLAIRFLKAKKP